MTQNIGPAAAPILRVLFETNLIRAGFQGLVMWRTFVSGAKDETLGLSAPAGKRPLSVLRQRPSCRIY
jgi:hypothetical protein